MNHIERFCLATGLALLTASAWAQSAPPAASAPQVSAAASAIAEAVKKSAAKTAKANDIVEFKDQDPAMREAFKKARASLDRFFTETSTPTDNMETISLKVAVREGKLVEYFWITPFTRDLHGQRFSGAIDGKPAVLKKVKEDQVVKFKRADIVDWMYVQIKPRVMHGNYTTCVQAKDSPADLAALKKQYGLDCAAR